MCWNRVRKNALFIIALPVVTACLLTLQNCSMFSNDCRNCAIVLHIQTEMISKHTTKTQPSRNIIYCNVKGHKTSSSFFSFMKLNYTSSMYRLTQSIFITCWQTLSYKHFSGREVFSENLNISFPLVPLAEDDLGIASLTTSHIQTSSPQPAYALNTQTPNFVTSHMLGQSYATENSNFGPMYHHHNSHHHAGLPYSYEKYKMPASPSTNVYPHYQGFYGHQIRQVEYIPR